MHKNSISGNGDEPYLKTVFFCLSPLSASRANLFLIFGMAAISVKQKAADFFEDEGVAK